MNTAMRMTASAARLLLLCGCASVLLTGPGSAQQSSVVTYPTSVGISSPLSSAPPASAAPTTGQMPLVIPLHALPHGQTVPGADHASDHAAQTNAAQVLAPQPQANFQGITQNGYIPPDPNIAVGPTQIVEMVNSELAIYDKGGGLLLGPISLSNLWTNLGGACGNSGDPVVQYDALATNHDGGTGAWFISQLQSLSSPYGECIAVSQGSDPSGAYWLYYYSFGSNLNDYPKFGVWPTTSNSAYLGTYNLFANGSNFVGAALCAYDRAKMLVGDSSARQICQQTSASEGGFLPSDLDGALAPASGEPGYFLAYNATNDGLTLYTASLDWSKPGLTAATIAAVVPDIAVTPFVPACGGTGGTCVPQPSTKKKLDTLGDRLMYRLAYRNFGSGKASMVVNHSVTSPTWGTVAPRWYKLDETGPGQFNVAQWGNYDPDSNYRWMGSIAMNQSGDILLGYSRSSSSLYPSIAVTGATASDLAAGNGLAVPETVLKVGGGSQTMYTRWGDYTAMRIDPANDCTFWYVNEYYPSTSFGNWYTFIGSAVVPGSSCGATVSNTPDFSVSSSSPIVVQAGTPSNGTISLASINGFAGSIVLSTNCALVTCSPQTPVSLTANGSATSSMTVSGTTAGSYSYQVTGTYSQTLSHSASFTVNVQVDFSLTANSATITIPRGGSGTDQLTLSSPGSANVTLSVTGLPRQTKASFGTTNTSGSNSSPLLTITVGSKTPKGTYHLMVNATDGDYSHSVPIDLTVS
jgi:hypothetical protein